ncbi:hypothetical protein SUDANB171_03586 [Streptomyces sp. enrichment culture]|uniref:hypothetical protein n=1 Tax=Streptomyces sp. enrichment culture TaxID=1795815 RepID=UPI003F567745
MRRIVTTAALVLALAAASAGQGHADPAPDGGACVPEAALDTATGSGADQVLALVDTLRASGADDLAVDAELAARACLVRATAAEPPIPDADLIDLAAPDVYVITTVGGVERWVAISAWQWQETPGHPMRGEQGVATWFDGEIRPILQVVHHGGTTPAFPSVSHEDAAVVNGHGVGFLLTPRQNATDTDVATGRTALVFEGTGGCRDITVRSAFAHTWNDTGISGLTVDAEGPAFGWTSTEDRALALSPPTTVGVDC